MNKIFYLKTCNTCTRIIKELNIPQSFTLQDVKSEPITVKQLEQLKAQTGSYEALFNKRCKLYTERGLKHENLTEDDYKNYILEHYTFLKRPVIVINDDVFVGNSKKVVEAAKNALHE